MSGSVSANEDEAIQVAVLSLVLELHPAQLTAAELIREMVDDPDDFAERDSIERAVRDLVGAGLLHRNGEFVLTTRAAVQFHRLAG